MGAMFKIRKQQLYSPAVQPTLTQKLDFISSDSPSAVIMVGIVLMFLLFVVVGGVISNVQVHDHYTTSSVDDLGYSLRVQTLRSAASQSEGFFYPSRGAVVAEATVLSSSLSEIDNTDSGWIFTPSIRSLTWVLALDLSAPHSVSIVSDTSDEALGYYGDGFISSTGQLAAFADYESVGFNRVVNDTDGISTVTVGQVNSTTGTWGPDDFTYEFVPGRDARSGAHHVRAKEVELGEYVVDINVIPWDRTATIITFAAPVRPLGGDCVAVVQAKITNSQLTSFLSSLDLLGGSMFVTTQDGFLVATSEGGVVVTSTGRPALLEAWNSPDPRISSASNYLIERLESWNDMVDRNASVHLDNVNVAGSKYFVDATVVPLGTDGTSLVIVLLTPRASIFSGTDKAYRMQLTINLVIAGVSIFVGVILTTTVTRRIVDVRELQKRNQLYLAAKREAELTTRYLANTSHEIRTPMAGIIGMLSFTLEDPALTSAQLETFTTMQQCAEALLGLLNDVLEVEKMESGHLELEHVEFDARTCVEQCVALFAGKCSEKGVELGIDYGGLVPVLLMGDPGRVRQVVTNLLSNAVKFARTGFVCVRVWVEEAAALSGGGVGPPPIVMPPDGTGHYWCLEVEDTGPGIVKDKQDMIFEAFTQEKASTSRVYGGTGLGLNIVRTLVQNMGGRIQVSSKDKELDGSTGCRFRVTLPLRAKVRPAETPPIAGLPRAVTTHKHDCVGISVVRSISLVSSRHLMSTILPRALAHQFDAPCVVDGSLDAVLERGMSDHLLCPNSARGGGGGREGDSR